MDLSIRWKLNCKTILLKRTKTKFKCKANLKVAHTEFETKQYHEYIFWQTQTGNSLK